MVQLSKSWRVLGFATLVGIAGCLEDPIGPRHSASNAATEVSSARSIGAKTRDFRARNGDLFRLNSDAATLTVRGKTVSVPAAMVPRLEKLLDVHAKEQARSARFDADRNHRKYRAELAARGRRGRQVRARAATPQNVAPRLLAATMNPASGTVAARPSAGVGTTTSASAEVQTETSVCRDLSETMFDKQQELNNLNYEIGQLLWAIIRAQSFPEPWNPNWVAGLGTLFTQLTQLEMQQWSLEIQLTVIAAMWNLNNCWDWQNTPPPVVGGGGDDSGDSGAGGSGGSSCHQEYAYIEESYDDGVTWVVVWEGWVTVC